MRFRELCAIASSVTLVSLLSTGCAEDGMSEDSADPSDNGVGAAADAAPTTVPAKDAGAADTGHAAADAARSDTGTPDASGDASGSDASTLCPPPNACASAKALPQLSADTGNDVRTVQGTTSEWVQVLATENGGSIFGHDLRIKATLVSPPGENFDLYLYQGGDAPALPCGIGPSSTSVLTIGTDTVTDKWDDQGDHPDTKIITFEVRHVSGTCAPGAQWTLSVMGNVN
jgi:hypothetical protein